MINYNITERDVYVYNLLIEWWRLWFTLIREGAIFRFPYKCVITNVLFICNTVYIRPVRSNQFLILHIKYNTYLYFSIICINNFYKKIVTFGHKAFKV